MVLRESIGSMAAITALGASVLLVMQNSSSAFILPLLGVVLGGLILSAALRGHPALFSSAGLLGWFAIMFAAPFSITTREANALRRVANRGDEEAKALLEYYETFSPYATYLMLGITALIIAVVAFGMIRGRMSLHQNLLDASNGIGSALSRIGIAAAIVLFSTMIFAIMYDVVQRQYLSSNPSFTGTAWYKMFSSTRVQEMEWHLHAALFLLVLGYAYVKDAHVRIELVRDMLRPRTRVWIELMGCLLFMVPYCYVVMKYGIENAMRSYDIGESSAALTGLPYRFIIKSMLPVGFALIALAGLSVAMKCMVYLFGPASLQRQANYYAHSHQNPAPKDTDLDTDLRSA
jgi:TRAP-type mannitol/chloroaromatic compound transport system permease small subunit